MAFRVVSNRSRCKARICVSTLLFVLVVELLAKKIRHNEEIKGILKNIALKDDLKLLENADDMTLLLIHESDLK